MAGCRAVVTGSYHAGVFALSQGIPVVGLAKSPYYRQKFAGLAAQFGEGCRVVGLPRGAAELSADIFRAWQDAPRLRPRLQERAREQAEDSRRAYLRLKELFDSRRSKGAPRGAGP